MSKKKSGPVTIVQQNVKAPEETRHLYQAQASDIRTHTGLAAKELQAYIGEPLLKRWAVAEVAPGLTPVAAMNRAADVANAYATQAGVDVVAANQLRVTLEAARNSLSQAALGKVVSDVQLRNSEKASRPAKAFAEVVTRALRVVTQVCESGNASKPRKAAALT